MIRGVLFDMDGVLVNNTQAHVKAFEIFCERYGVEDWQHKLQTAFGMGNDDIMRLILPEEIIREKGMKALGEEKEAIYREVYAPEIRPVRGLVELLEELRRRGIRCAVGSSGCRENVDFVLSNCGITDYFSCIVSGDRVTRCKPDPEIYLLAAEGLHLPSAECLVFEDARVGITAARRAGAGRIVALATLPAIKDFGEFLPALKAISGDLSIDDLSSLEGVLDLSGCTFSPNSTLDLRLVAATRLTELRGGDFGGSLRIDASSLTPQPEAMPFGITGFKNLDTLRIAGFTHVSELSLPTESCDDLTIENCGSQAPFTLSLPNLVEVRGTLLCRNCGKAGEANSASFPRLKNVGRQLSFYVGASSFTVLEFPLLETVGNGEPVSDDPADDYALYTMPSGCAGEFILPSLQRVNGSMLVSTWNTSTDRAVAFRFPSLQSVAGEISVGHTAYKNRSVATLDFSALTAAGAIRIGNLSSVTDFSTFTQVLPRLSEQTWSVTDCSYNPTYQQMLDGETGAESK